MDSDSDKENYFSLYMKKKKSESQKKGNFRSNKRLKNKCASSQKLKDGTNNKNSMKLLLESPEKKHKSKNAFSFVKSNLLNIKDNKNKNKHSTKNKNMTTEKQKMKNEKFNKSTSDIKKYAISSPKNNYEFNDNKKNDNQKIEKIQNRIFNLMDIINTFENDFIKSKKPLQIKQQFDKIKYKITPIPLKLNLEKNINKVYKNNITDRTNYFNNDYQNISKTERINYPQKEISENSKNKIAYVYSKLFDDFKNINFNLDNKNIIHTKRTNGMRQHSAMNQRISSDKNMAIIILNKQKNNNNNINKNSINNNSAFMKLISSELKKMNSNFAKNKSKSLVNKMNINSNSSSNKTLYKNENIDEKKQKQNIFKRRINYSNFINQKMKQNIIIHRNQGNYLKQNMANKSKNNNKSNGCNTCFDLNHNDNYVKNLLNKNGKSKSIDRSN